MATQDKQLSPARRTGFFREGWRELGRKWERYKLHGQLRRQEAERVQALTRLGWRAWQEKVDLSAFRELAAQITQLESRAGVLGAAAADQERERTALEEKRRAEAARFDGERRSVEDRKRPVDEALRVARQRLSEQERAAQRLAVRLADLPRELTGVEQQVAALASGAAPERDAKVAAAEARRQQLLAEQAQITVELPKANEPLPALRIEVARLDEESRRYAAEINRIETERRSTISALEAELGRVRGQLAATAREAGAVEKERGAHFAQLGLGLYEQNAAHPSLADIQKEVAVIDQGRAATQSALQVSSAETQWMPRGTMLKFAAVLVLAPLLLVGVLIGGYLVWSWWSERPPAQVTEVNPYLSHPLQDRPAYQLANRLAEAKTEGEAAEQILDAFRALHLGVYSGDGKQILAGSERSDKDFFLYDFQWKMLSRAFFKRGVTRFSDQSWVFGRVFLGLTAPEQLEPFFSEAIVRRYQQAAERPGDPQSYLILLIDGLARRQIQPYALSELKSRDREGLYLDRLQSFLLMLDFFLGRRRVAPAASAAGAPLSSSWSWSLLPAVHADSPCDFAGDGTQEAWGRGVDVAGDVMEEAGEQLGKEGLNRFGSIFGNTMDVLQAAGDLLLLNGITIELSVAPKQYVHLPPSGEDRTSVMADVSFDPQGVPDEVLKCGWMAGKKLPAAGPMKDVELYWEFKPFLAPDFRAATEISWHTETPGVKLEHVHEGFRTKTDENGWSAFPLVTIRNCRNHIGGGMVVSRRYTVTVSARVVTQEIPTPGLLSAIGLALKLGPGALEYLMQGRSGDTWVVAEWHEKKPEQKQY